MFAAKLIRENVSVKFVDKLLLRKSLRIFLFIAAVKLQRMLSSAKNTFELVSVKISLSVLLSDSFKNEIKNIFVP